MMNRSTECPNCENPFPKMASDKSYYCPECGRQWTDKSSEAEFIGNQILDHAEDMVRLLTLLGFKDDSLTTGTTSIDIRLWHDGIEVEASLQDIKTIRRKKA